MNSKFVFLITIILDDDECTSNVHQCKPNADCVNVDGSYQCNCKPGYTGDGLISCGGTKFHVTKSIFRSYLLISLEIDECALELDDCDENAICKNTKQSFICECKEGFKGDGKECIGKICL